MRIDSAGRNVSRFYSCRAIPNFAQKKQSMLRMKMVYSWYGYNKAFKIVGEFSLVCCTSMTYAGNTKIWAFSSLRGGGGGGAKNASIYALSGHERIGKRSDQ